jgi:hypothetical protein
MEEYKWEHLNKSQLGKYAEYYVKMELIRYGLDVYTHEVDDKAIDFVVRVNANKYYDIQVKSSRNLNYIYLTKDKYDIRNNLLAAIVLFFEGKPPQFYLIPLERWKRPDSLFSDRNYEDKKSKPEWGLHLSMKNLPLLSEFSYENIIKKL